MLDKTPDAVVSPSLGRDEATFRGCCKRQTKLMLCTLFCCMLSAGLQCEVLGVASPTIAKFFSAELQLSWMGTAGALMQVGGVLVFGKAFDVFEPKMMLMLCLALSIFGSALSAVAWRYSMLIIGQGIAGFGRAGLIVGNAMILAIICPDKKERTVYLGLVSGAYAVMLKISPLVAGGILAIHIKEAWRGVFWVCVPPQGLLLVIVWTFPRLRCKPARWQQVLELGPARMLLYAGAIVGLLLPLMLGQYSGTLSFRGPLLVACYIGGPILLGGFIFAELWHAEQDRLLPMEAITRHPRMLCALMMLTAAPSLAIVTGTFYSPPYFEIVRGHTPLMAAMLQLPSILVGAAVAVVISKWYLHGPRWAQGIAIVSAILQIAGGSMFYAFSQDVNIYLIHFSGMLTSIGAGLTFAMGMALILEYVPETRFGAAASLMNLSSAFGAVFGTSVYGLLLQHQIRAFTERALAFVAALAQADVGLATVPEISQLSMDAAPAFQAIYHTAQRYACLYLYGGAGVASLVAALCMGPHLTKRL